MNKSIFLLFIDSTIGSVLLLVGIIFKFIYRLLNLKYSSDKVLIIKILGAGNFYAIEEILEKDNVCVVTSKDNFFALKKINPKIKIYEINDKNLLSLTISTSYLIFNLLKINFSQVINLESESKFAKFLCSITRANKVSGLTNKNKSFLDILIYDNYLVSPFLINKTNQIYQLIKFTKIINPAMKLLVDKQHEKFIKILDLEPSLHVTVTPSCNKSKQHHLLRRLKNSDWEYVLRQLFSIDKVVKIKVIFPNENDSQFDFFFSLQRKYEKIEILITNYEQFVDSIKKCNLLLTIDSQALHIGQKFKKPIICFYGPSNPLSINIIDSTLPIYQSLECSPCTDKYLKLPCSNKAPCMNFTKKELDLTKFINKS
jgi:ADP-heptose:LPS heptosyltransferase